MCHPLYGEVKFPGLKCGCVQKNHECHVWIGTRVFVRWLSACYWQQMKGRAIYTESSRIWSYILKARIPRVNTPLFFFSFFCQILSWERKTYRVCTKFIDSQHSQLTFKSKINTYKYHIFQANMLFCHKIHNIFMTTHFCHFNLRTFHAMWILDQMPNPFHFFHIFLKTSC